MFADKLNFLISIVGISGGELAHAVDLDPSYISRLRHGKRALPKEHHFIEPISLYFATHIKSDYQKTLLCDAMGVTLEWPETTEKAKKYITSWLLTENPRQYDMIRNVFLEIARSFPLDSSVYIEALPDLSEYSNDTREIYFGKEGKRDAFLRFFALAIEAEDSQEMQMFCNEDLSWQSETPGFRQKVRSLLTVFAKAGKKIKIIHSLSEDIDSMLESLQGWIPIYLTGYVEPSYYPKIREDFYRRTAFVVPGVAAMISSSLNGNTGETMTFILTKSEAVKVVEAELSYLMSQSKPLTKSFSAKNKEGLHSVLREFFNAKADTILVHDDFLPFILPANISKVKALRDFFYFKNIEGLLKKYNYTEVISVPDVTKIRNGNVPVQLSGVIESNQTFFTKDEYIKNLDHVLELLEAESSYSLHVKNHAFQDIFLCIKKGVGILIAKEQDSSVLFYIEQPNIVDVVWEFLSITNRETTVDNQQEVLRELHKLSKALKTEL
ncbi:MAG: hypothetical protein EOM59_10520 [Clostridia bacterium]|nr:hypothetical protein [Clostridia bacterium]